MFRSLFSIGPLHNTVFTKISLTQVAKIFFISSPPYSNPSRMFSQPKNKKRACFIIALPWRFLAPGALYTEFPNCFNRSQIFHSFHISFLLGERQNRMFPTLFKWRHLLNKNTLCVPRIPVSFSVLQPSHRPSMDTV